MLIHFLNESVKSDKQGSNLLLRKKTQETKTR